MNLFLQTLNHKFEVIKTKERVNHCYYTIKNQKHNTRVCMDILVWKNDSDWWASIEYLEYDAACSSNDLERKSGTIEMVQGLLSALLRKHPKISTIELSDKSFFTSNNGDHIPLPEYRMITKGKTWYEEHFKAVPGSTSLSVKHQQYANAHKKLEKELIEIKSLTLTSFKEFLRKNKLRQLSGNVWYIPIGAVKNYPFQGSLKKHTSSIDGGHTPLIRKPEYIFSLYGV